MGVFSYDMEVTSSVPPPKLFKAFVLDSDNLIAKLMPQAIANVQIIQGDGGPGTIRKITFGQGSQFKYVKHRIDEIDQENFEYRYSVIEGDVLMNVLAKISHEIKFEPTSDGGSLCKSSSKYYTIEGFQLQAEKIKDGKERALSLFKAVEAYLLANPHYY